MAGGAALSVLVETVLPEAVHGAPKGIAVITAAGFLAVFALARLGG